jgi:ABC-2 type transport system ATP-binding protein
MGEAAIVTRSLTKRYGDFVAVDHLDLEVRRGEIFGLLGPNGAGKTTTILMLLGLSEPSEGSAEVLGLDPTRHPLEVKSKVGYLPDSVGFYEALTGRENLRYTARLNGLVGAEAERRIEHALEQVGLTEAADHKAGTYSRGMRQRLGIADALIKDPEVMILDEPTVAIDPEGVAQMLDLIRSLARERNVTMLLSSHLLHQVQAVCDRVGIFVKGRLVAIGTTAELAERFSGGAAEYEVATSANGAAGGVLEGLPGVRSVRRDGEFWVVAAEPTQASSIVTTLAGRGLEITHFRRRGQDLDELYRRYFKEASKQEGGGGSG